MNLEDVTWMVTANANPLAPLWIEARVPGQVLMAFPVTREILDEPPEPGPMREVLAIAWREFLYLYPSLRQQIAV